MSPTLAELTETELLRRLARFAPPDQLVTTPQPWPQTPGHC